MKLLSEELVSLEYREQLQCDLAQATVCRFLVAYISNQGMDSIGRHLLNRALRDDRSFGVGSLTCSCRYEPLLRLQSELPQLRLKYFMDPLVREDDEPSEVSLFHSKLVYLLLERQRKSIVYIGSHNWTRRAIGPQGPRNAEASLRIEMDFSPQDLDGTSASVAGHVNRHLLDAWNMPLCLPATPENEPAFREWYEKGCRRSPAAPLQETTILLAVRRTPASGNDWLALTGRGIYLQVLDVQDGELLWKSGNRVLVLVWNSEAELASARQPVILECETSTSNARRNSHLDGTNTSAAPIAGFRAVIWDDAEFSARRSSQYTKRPPVRLWSGRDVYVYDFEFPTPYSDSSQVDGAVRPEYQFHLEVRRVVLPAAGTFMEMPGYIWSPDSFSVAATREAARVEESPGYFVPPQRERQIIDCLSEVLFVAPNQAKVLPYSSIDRSRVGKRVSTHALHETFLGPEWREKRLRDEYYERSEPGALVADLDVEPARETEAHDEKEPVPRLQRVFTSPLDRLVHSWGEAARLLRSQTGGDGHDDRHNGQGKTTR